MIKEKLVKIWNIDSFKTFFAECLIYVLFLRLTCTFLWKKMVIMRRRIGFGSELARESKLCKSCFGKGIILGIIKDYFWLYDAPTELTSAQYSIYTGMLPDSCDNCLFGASITIQNNTVCCIVFGLNNIYSNIKHQYKCYNVIGSRI